jgi:cell division protein FtsW (lipid II flippase)
MPALVILSASLLILLTQRDLGTATIFILLFSFIIYCNRTAANIIDQPDDHCGGWSFGVPTV